MCGRYDNLIPRDAYSGMDSVCLRLEEQLGGATQTPNVRKVPTEIRAIANGDSI
jgi:hypothetical protein